MGKFKDVLQGSAAKTNDELASQLSGLTKLKDSEINAVFPERGDKENLARLLDIVNDATDENNKVKQLKDNIESLAGTVVKLLGVLV